MGSTAVGLAAALCISVTLTASAAPLWAEVVTIREPDGSSVEIRVWGDEFYSVGETLDGFTVVRDGATGILSYAELSADGTELVSTGVPAGEPAPRKDLEKHIRITTEAARSQALAVREDFERRAPLNPLSRGARGPTTGNVVGITLIVDFSDDPGAIPASSIDDYCNMNGYTGYGNHGSVRDYYFDVSEGLLDYTNYVAPQYYRAQHPKSYYTDPSRPYGQRARELVQEALQNLDNNGLDFSQFDADGNGIVDAVNCFYAGDTWNAWAEGLWPHASAVTWCADGVCTYPYQITNTGNSLTISTFCHENGHMLMGWPDLYDYGGDSAGVGQFCIMCYGTSGTNPCEPCAYMKYDAGWGDVTVLTNPQGGLTAPNGTNVMYKFEHPELPNEYYLVENRQQTGRDAGIPDRGLAIWHIDTQGSNNNQQQTPEQHYLVTLVQADGRWDMENNVNGGDGTDLYASTRYPECTPLTYPNTGWWDGSESGAFFLNISGASANMTLDFHNAAYVLELASSTHATEMEYGGTALYTATLRNWAPVDDTATVEVGHDLLPDGVGPSDWTAEFREVGGTWQTGPVDFVLGPDEQKDLEVRVIDGIGTVAGMAVTTLSAQSGVDPQSSADISFGTFVEAPSILIVDDDNGGDYETYLETALADTGYGAMIWDAAVRGRPSLAQMSSYGAVLWTTGAGNALYLTSSDEQSMMDYLDAGGNLFLTSAEYLSSRSLPNAFISDYLHVDSWISDNSGFLMTGVAGDPVSDGMALMVLGGPILPANSDAIIPAAPADSVFSTPVGIKGIRVDENDHKVVFLSFPFENAPVGDPYPNNQKTLVARILGWFGSLTGVEMGDIDRLAMRQNAPNPFNPITTIAFAVPEDASRVTLMICNVNGRVVRRLIDEPLSAGPHTIVWNGRDDTGRSLPSGVYFARLAAGGESLFRKMTLLK